MSTLLVKQVKYIGEDYIYESPILTSGINILEGENGSGKSTFSNLIYFGLGGHVKWFRSNSQNDHKQIVEDKSNYVELAILLNDVEYLLTRYFYKFEINVLGPDVAQTLPIIRGPKKEFTFSDWILEKMEIQVVDIYQGSEYYKINFNDLARLFYYDQETSPGRIYKAPDTENFITDSTIIRKAIFEILTGNSFTDYYQAISDYRKSQQEAANMKLLIQNFTMLNSESSDLYEGKNAYSLGIEIEDLKSQLKRANEFRDSIKLNETSIKSSTEIITDKRRLYSVWEDKRIQLKKQKSDLRLDYSKVKRLKSDLILEVTQMKKILVANENLNLFSPDTCPYCLKRKKRGENECICGNEISEEQFQKFFYTKEEYFKILNSKQKNIESVTSALNSYADEIKELDHKIGILNGKMSQLKSEINSLVRGRTELKNYELGEVNDKILKIEKAISGYNQQIKLELKREELIREQDLLDEKVRTSRGKMEVLRSQTENEMDEIISKFNTKYFSLMKKALFDCHSAKISNDNYMPIINSGSYKEASSNVSKRLMYFFTLLHLSLTMPIKYPKFLLIDTPENIGIDDPALIQALSLINEIGNAPNGISKGQIILTTGHGKYPDLFKKNVFNSISKRSKLLIKRTIDTTL